jgi:hypothetical protein
MTHLSWPLLASLAVTGLSTMIIVVRVVGSY